MTSYQGSRVTVPRDLWIAALADAIDWTETLVDSQRGAPDPATLLRLARYRKAYERATGSKRGPLTAALERAPAIPLHELMASDKLRWPAGEDDLS